MRTAAALVLATLVLACDGALSPAEPAPGTLLVAFESGYGAPARLVVRDDTTWADLWATIQGPFAPTPERPAVDFSRDMLLVAAMGARPTTGYRIVVPEVTAQGAGLRALVVEESPGHACGVGAMITHPVTVIRVGRTDGPVDFVEVARTIDCR